MVEFYSNVPEYSDIEAFIHSKKTSQMTIFASHQTIRKWTWDRNLFKDGFWDGIRSPPNIRKSTSHVEQAHLTMRSFDGRLSRKTLTFSKEFAMYRASVAWENLYDNLARPVKNLSVKNDESEGQEGKGPFFPKPIHLRHGRFVWIVQSESPFQESAPMLPQVPCGFLIKNIVCKIAYSREICHKKSIPQSAQRLRKTIRNYQETPRAMLRHG